MGKKLNCWEFMKCGLGPGGGNNTAEPGLCSAVTNQDADGINGGTNGGRICWAIAGSFCLKQSGGMFAQKKPNCMMCGFYELVLKEEGSSIFSLHKK